MSTAIPATDETIVIFESTLYRVTLDRLQSLGMSHFILVNRGGTDYWTVGEAYKSSLQNTDTMLVWRNGTAYHATIQDIKGAPSLPKPTAIQLLVVAGGGGKTGSSYTGGGGGGGLTQNTNYAITAGTKYLITVGAGGTLAASNSLASNGGQSKFGTVSTTGGGRGGKGTPTYGNGATGGCGGGGAAFEGNATGGSNTTGQGNRGGSVTSYGAAGGGGRNSAAPSVSNGGAGKGGDGAPLTITGTSIYYSAGGGGSSTANGSAGEGWVNAPNTGHGAHSGNPGQSGVVVVAYQNTYAPPTEITGTYETPTRAGYRVYKFTGSGSITF